MRRTMIFAFALLVGFAVTRGPVRSDEPKKPPTQTALVGTWRLVSAKYGGEAFKFPKGTTMLKHITPTHFIWVTHDEEGKVSRTAGGPYTLKGEDYVETPEYGMSADFDIIKGKAQKFKCKVDGNTWHHDGELSNGLAIEETWERVEKKSMTRTRAGAIGSTASTGPPVEEIPGSRAALAARWIKPMTQEDLLGELEAATSARMPLLQIILKLRNYRRLGVTRHEVHAALVELRHQAQDEATEDRILEVLDIVTGFCSPRYRVWED